jgi:hypothetical protein
MNLDTDIVTRCEVIDHREETHTPGRFYVAYDVMVTLDVQDDGRTLKVFLDDRSDTDVEGEMVSGLKAVFGTVVSRQDFDRLAKRVEDLEMLLFPVPEIEETVEVGPLDPELPSE